MMLGVGGFNMLHGPKTMVYQAEYRFNAEIYRKGHFLLRPLVGAMMTGTRSSYFYGGIAFDFIFKHFAITPSFAPGIYFQGGGKNLYYPLEFRSTFEMAGIFTNKARLGFQFYHISNASLGRKNPGTECLVFFWAIPFN